MDRDSVVTFDPRSWVVWVMVAAAIAIVVRNPLYSLIILITTLLVGRFCAEPGPRLPRPGPRIVVTILLFTTLFNGLSVHVGEHVLFRLPANMPWIGGPVTLEAAVYGASVGLTLLTLLTLFMAFNAIVPTSELVRLVPRAFRDMGVVLLISMTYVPETQRQLRRIQEAQAIRGHQMRGLRDWQPVLVSLTIGALERAMGLAEAMVARGYGATASARQPLVIQLGLVAGLLAALSGWVLTFWIGWLGWLLLVVGVLMMAALTVRLGRGVPRTHYRRRPWQARDSWLLATLLIPTLVTFVNTPFTDRSTLVYMPYPSLSFPPFDPFIGIALAALILPALLSTTSQAR